MENMRRSSTGSIGASRALALISGHAIVLSASLLTGLRTFWSGTKPTTEQTLYFANHTSHGDFVLLWASLPRELRQLTRPVAGADYWLRSRLRHFIAANVFNALMIDRDGSDLGLNPVSQMIQALNAGDSLIMFPEGTRNTSDDILLPFKSGLFHLALACPQVRLVPVWIENLKRVLPKGSWIPVPLACTVHFGTPIQWQEGEDKAAFLARARAAVLALHPEHAQDDKDQQIKR